MKTLHAYLHGFASSSQSKKGQELRERYESLGREFLCPELNRPSFGEQTFTDNLAYLDQLDGEMQAQHGPDFRWRLIASSMGGYLGARWAEQRPDRVDRLLLLCPAFDFGSRWPKLLGDALMKHWEKAGKFPFPGPAGAPVEVHWRFVEDARSHPPHPVFSCPAHIIHGSRDIVVPIESSREYSAAHSHVELTEVEDDHPLEGSLEEIWRVVREFLIAD
jgi:pimeloyl-ACP methyl ester carboxylesterase